MSPVTFFLLRHAQTDWNVQKRLQGSNDVPLNDTGRVQARALRPFFDALVPDAWFSSPLSRARESLRLATGVEPEKIVIDVRLGEVGLGALEGLAQDEIQRKFGADLWSKWSTISPDGKDFAFPGAESPRESNARLRAGLADLAASGAFRRAVVCTHGFLMRRFLQELDPVEPPRIVPNGLVAEISFSGDGGFRLERLHEPSF